MKVSVLSCIVLAMAVNFLTAENTQNNIDKNSPLNSLEGEFLLDTSYASVPGYGEQRDPVVASDGSNFLIVWTDYRNGTPAIYGTLMDSSGNSLDGGFPIATRGETQCAPDVAFDGINYLVVWQGYSYCSYINGARVTVSGQVLDTAGLVINASPGNHCPKVAFDGTNFCVVWDKSSSQIFGARVTTGGVVLDPAGFFVAGGCVRDLVWANTNYLIVFHKYRYPTQCDAVYGIKLDAGGVVLDSAFRISSLSQAAYQPAAAFDGTNCLVAWRTYQQAPSSVRIMASRIAPNGTVLDTAGIYLSSDTAGFPAVAFDGTNYLVVWADRNSGLDNFDIRAVRVSTAGQVLEPAGITVSGADSIQARPALAFGGDRCLIAWQDTRQKANFRYDIYAARVLASGFVQDPQGIAVRKSIPARQTNSTIAFDGTNYLVVWLDARNVSFPQLDCDIYGIRVDDNGNVIDNQALPITLGRHDIRFPSICYGTSKYLLTWAASRAGYFSEDIFGAMITPDGTVTDSFIISDSLNNHSVTKSSVAFGDTVFLVVWEQWGGIMASRVSQSGRVIDPGGFIVDTNQDHYTVPTLNYGNSNFMIIWKGANALLARRIAVDGSMPDSMPIVIDSIECFANSYSLAFDGINYLVVWSDWVGGTNYDIFGRRISQSGVVLDTNRIIISDLPITENSPEVEYDGANYVIVWEGSPDSVSCDLYGAKVSPQGQVVSWFPVVTLPMDQYEPALARGTGDRMLLAYTGWISYINSHPAGTERIWGKMYPFTGLQETSAVGNVGLDFLTARPNPFRTRIEFQLNPGKAQSTTRLGGAERIELTIYDVSGRLIRSFAICPMLSALCWDGTDQSGRKVAAGIYFVHLTAPDRESVQKIILLK